MARSESDHVQTEDAIALLQGGLKPAQAEHVLAHVDHCAACNELVIAMARMPTIRAEVVTQPDRPGAGEAPTVPPDAVADDWMLRIAGRYQLRKILGAGGMGVVYEAHDHELDRRVALKLVRHDHGSEPEHAARRLVGEARAMARLHHPAVITVYDAGTTEGQAFIAMELIDGGTMRAWLASRRRSWREIVRVFVQAAHGLAAAHAAGMVHGDVKPDNVLVDRVGRARVADLGLARAAGGGAGDSLVGGTVAYMAPEQLDGKIATAASDQYAFGIALHEALHGHRPNSDTTKVPRTTPNPIRRVARWVVADDPPNRIARMVRHMLADDPAARFPSMTSVAIALERTLRRRWPWVFAAAGVAAVAIVAVALRFRDARGASPCDDEAARASGWDPAAASRLRDAFAASGAADAADRAGAVTTTLDAYDRRLRSEREVACAADTAATVTRQKLACLDRRRRALATAVDTLTDHPSRAVVTHAIGVVADLPASEVCREAEFLLEPAPPAERRGEIEAIEVELDRARLLRASGQLEDARRVAVAAADRAVRSGWAPVETAAWLAVARLHELAHDVAGSEAALNRAIAAAARSRDDRGAALGLTRLFEGVVDQGRFAEAERLAPLAEAAVVRAGDPPDLRAGLHLSLGWLEAQRSNDWPAARRHWQQGLALFESSRGATSEQVGVIHIDLALVELQLDRPDAALAELARAEAILRDRLALAELANYHNYKCRAHDMLGDLDRAAAECTAALGSIQDGLGPEHPMATSAEDSLAVVLEHQGKLAQAIPHYQRALEIQERAEGSTHFVSLEVRTNLADALVRAGRHADAETVIAEGIKIAEAAYGADHVQVGYLLLSRAELRRAQARPTEAIADLERALPIMQRAGDDPDTVDQIRTGLDELRAATGPT